MVAGRRTRGPVPFVTSVIARSGATRQFRCSCARSLSLLRVDNKKEDKNFLWTRTSTILLSRADRPLAARGTRDGSGGVPHIVCNGFIEGGCDAVSHSLRISYGTSVRLQIDQWRAVQAVQTADSQHRAGPFHQCDDRRRDRIRPHRRAQGKRFPTAKAGGFSEEGIVTPVGTLASPVMWRSEGRRATQASPPHATLPPPLRHEASSRADQKISGCLMYWRVFNLLVPGGVFSTRPLACWRSLANSRLAQD